MNYRRALLVQGLWPLLGENRNTEVLTKSLRRPLKLLVWCSVWWRSAEILRISTIVLTRLIQCMAHWTTNRTCDWINLCWWAKKRQIISFSIINQHLSSVFIWTLSFPSKSAYIHIYLWFSVLQGIRICCIIIYPDHRTKRLTALVLLWRQGLQRLWWN